MCPCKFASLWVHSKCHDRISNVSTMPSLFGTFLSGVLLHISHNEFQSCGLGSCPHIFLVMENFNSSGKHVGLLEGQKGMAVREYNRTRWLNLSSLEKSLLRMCQWRETFSSHSLSSYSVSSAFSRERETEFRWKNGISFWNILCGINL